MDERIDATKRKPRRLRGKIATMFPFLCVIEPSQNIFTLELSSIKILEFALR